MWMDALGAKVKGWRWAHWETTGSEACDLEARTTNLFAAQAPALSRAFASREVGRRYDNRNCI
jgi:hypothetical protein